MDDLPEDCRPLPTADVQPQQPYQFAIPPPLLPPASPTIAQPRPRPVVMPTPLLRPMSLLPPGCRGITPDSIANYSRRRAWQPTTVTKVPNIAPPLKPATVIINSTAPTSTTTSSTSYSSASLNTDDGQMLPGDISNFKIPLATSNPIEGRDPLERRQHELIREQTPAGVKWGSWPKEKLQAEAQRKRAATYKALDSQKRHQPGAVSSSPSSTYIDHRRCAMEGTPARPNQLESATSPSARPIAEVHPPPEESAVSDSATSSRPVTPTPDPDEVVTVLPTRPYPVEHYLTSRPNAGTTILPTAVPDYIGLLYHARTLMPLARVKLLTAHIPPGRYDVILSGPTPATEAFFRPYHTEVATTQQIDVLSQCAAYMTVHIWNAANNTADVRVGEFIFSHPLMTNHAWLRQDQFTIALDLQRYSHSDNQS